MILSLDAIERLPGFALDCVEWDHFRFHGHRAGGVMDTVAIYAYTAAPETSGFARFAVTDRDRRYLTSVELAWELDVSAGSATQTMVVLRDALREYTAAHAPQAVRAAHKVREAFTRPPAIGLRDRADGRDARPEQITLARGGRGAPGRHEQPRTP